MKKRNESAARARDSILIVAASFLLALLVGAVILLLQGENPIEVYNYLLIDPLISKNGLLKVLGKATPLIFTGLAGTLALFGLGGAPVEAGLTRLTPEPLVVSTWSQGLLYGVAGTVAALLLAALVGLLMRPFKHRSTWLGAITVSAAVAVFLGWAMGSQVLVPEGLGAPSTLWVNPLAAAAVGAVLAAVTRFVAGPPRALATPAPAAPASPDSDVEQLLREVTPGTGPVP